MPASEAQIRANQANSLKSSGPRTPEGKQASRSNSYKHGMTATVVMPEQDAAEVDRLNRAFLAELMPPGQAGAILARRMATLAVRMDRCAVQETAALSARVRKVLDEFEAPEGMDAEEVEKLRAELAGVALFDSSKEGILARRYEAAAERGFFRALKELRQLKKDSRATAPVAEAPPTPGDLASFRLLEKEITKLEARMPKPTPYVPPKVPDSRFPADLLGPSGRVDVPISIGKRR